MKLIVVPQIFIALLVDYREDIYGYKSGEMNETTKVREIHDLSNI